MLKLSSKLLGRTQQATFLPKLYEKKKKMYKVQSNANPHPNWKEELPDREALPVVEEFFKIFLESLI